MQTVISQQGETIDRLVWRITGATTAVEAVLEANPGLADLGLILPIGTAVRIPDSPDQTSHTTRTTLWD